jgi:hypothetical protein
MPIIVIERRKARVFGRSLVRIAGSNPAWGAWMSVCCQSRVGSGLCVGLIAHPEESTECRVSECDREASIMRRTWSSSGCCPGGGGRTVYRRTSCIRGLTSVFK